jgi:biopolymer transport protein ExbD
LIILMVTASYIVSKAVPMDLPNAGSGETASTLLAISVDQDGKLYLDGEPVAEGDIERAAQRASEGSGEARAMIAADGRVRHKRVVRVIDLLRKSGVSNFAISVNPEELERAGG